MKKLKFKIFIYGIFTVLAIPLFFLSFQYFSRAASIKANLIINTSDTNMIGPFPNRWKALAQGGEESGVRMLGNVIPQVSELYPKYIRLDHIYDFYDVVSRDSSGNLSFNFDKLDLTVCDIYATGAKTFFSLGYMPPVIAKDGSLIGRPKDWNEWSLLVQKTIERYSGTSTVLPCNMIDEWKADIYYEVWNEPDLESFGKWSKGEYFNLYSYSVKGANNVTNAYPFKIGGPVTTALYRNWIQEFLKYTHKNNLRVDFISWHHYSKRTDDYTKDIINLNKWLSESPIFDQYENIPKVISEWGYDSEKNPIADTEVGAAHTLASIRNFITANIEAAFLFEIKDGPTLSWGILDYNGGKKPRWYALQMLNNLEGNQLIVNGEGSYVTALASKNQDKISVVITNYDQNGRNNELVPVRFTGLVPGKYDISKKNLNGQKETSLNVEAINGEINLTGDKAIVMSPNSIISLDLTVSQNTE
ncbi:MAG: Glycoside hydrolase family 39 [Candidatus Roizmanbacteria bacterium GW2011_GWA2_35_19]|uniref:Glycoside hydrolase family 39 n=2 Tax=Candidatus Roizmaniibacteriota TaxID=1752723 RepID=A0A0G0BUH6_9BACT|nr:MAG: Glycoside hydrolase family 39 [Candidatus Roizmanbacteria bacterium GW2011_GWC2_35_12]KKP72978.1 MAG: Glycoside hydrolase family 39 [Candidatus Roizmanbacteria bacterium GW2011_GWA2_35_19]